MPNKSSVDDLPKRLFQAMRQYEARVGERLTGVAFAAMVGVSQPTVSDWENGNRTPGLHQVEAIARTLGVSPGWLAFNEGVMLAGNHPPAKPMPPGNRKKVDPPRRDQR
jgi:transcriptional regulator with XRE-family HTH domain